MHPSTATERNVYVRRIYALDLYFKYVFLISEELNQIDRIVLFRTENFK